MYTLENDHLRVTIVAKGAELQSLVSKTTGLEYMWSGDPAVWAKHSPVLFPIVGTLKENTYFYQGQSYQLSRHGFAREMDFRVTYQTGQELVLTLGSNAATFKVYPFAFRLQLRYTLTNDRLRLEYTVTNPGDEELLFQVGGHPAFKVPLQQGEAYEDYQLEFNVTEDAGRWMISSEGLIENHSVRVLDKTSTLPLRRELFYKDAIVLKELKSTAITLSSVKHAHGLHFGFAGFPFFGIWAGKDADFVCLEPWCGIADPVSANQQLTDKEGINRLAPQQEFSRSWEVQPF